jgi:protein-L-isoaspartate(D-aspartate) O-methyltransferase
VGQDKQEERFEILRHRMVEHQIRRRDVSHRGVLAAMEKVPRHLFVSESQRPRAYDDHPLPVGWGQTISQPYIVALMAELLDLAGGEKVLEIGTGCGYHAAVLAEVVEEVFTVEIIEPLARGAEGTLAALNYDNVYVRVGDGYQGWPEKAPFDAISITAAPPRIPEPLLRQLAMGGKMVLPVGHFFQDLQVVTRTEAGIETENVIPVRFVPMTGAVQESN